MSMWEIEGLTEMAVEFIAGNEGLSVQERRVYYAALYDLEELWDCSYTHFRSIEILERDGFMHGVPITAHPAFGPELGALAEAKAAKHASLWVRMDPEDPGSETAGIWTAREVGEPYRLWFDLRSPLAKVLAERGELGLEPSELPEALEPRVTFARLLELSAQDPSPLAHEITHGYYGFGAWCLNSLPDPVEPGDPVLSPVLASNALRARLAAPPKTDWILERFALPPAGPDLPEKNQAFLSWWRAPSAGA